MSGIVGFLPSGPGRPELPRTPRLDAPGSVHHVMVRGIARSPIFEDSQDRWDLVERLERLLREERALCFAWAFMPNHVHMVLQSGDTGLPRFMARLCTGHAVRFNLRHDRVGHLFQNRYQSRLVHDDVYARTLVRYVHANPIGAGLVESTEELESYPWTGHAELMGARAPRVIAVAEVLGWFGDSPDSARSALRQLMAQPDPVLSRDLDTAESSLRSAGRAASAASITASQTSRCDALDELIRAVCTRCGSNEAHVRDGRRTVEASRARSLIAYLAWSRLEMKVSEVAEVLGISKGAASRAVTRGRALARGPD